MGKIEAIPMIATGAECCGKPAAFLFSRGRGDILITSKGLSIVQLAVSGLPPVQGCAAYDLLFAITLVVSIGRADGGK
ncbi:MAG: hypothetical protein VB089_12225 [Anaerolineaceae bacterium]|nr:hypothetical protein [Anaerolineaceae bacterium]